jgi:hypothetical protein
VRKRRQPDDDGTRGGSVASVVSDPDITPDTKDWTWVLERACPECGFDTRLVAPRDLAEVVRANAAAWQAVLLRPDVDARPSPGVWSPLEYACHVRDVFRVFTRRLELMLTQDDPLFENWDQDATALEYDYRSQQPAQVADELTHAGAAAAAAFAAVPDDAWTRTGRRSDGARFTVETLGRYFVHDPVHHLWDVGGR